jgi:hypothetical protein
MHQSETLYHPHDRAVVLNFLILFDFSKYKMSIYFGMEGSGTTGMIRLSGSSKTRFCSQYLSNP